MKTRANRRRWRTILIRPSLQLQVALTHSLLVVAVILTFLLAVVGTLHFGMYGSGQLWMRYASGELLLRLLSRFLVAIVVVVALSFFVHVVFTHRLCGPLVNITHTLVRMGRKDFTRRVFLRRSDFLNEEAKIINETMATLADGIREIRTIHVEVSSAVLQLPQSDAKDRIHQLLLQEQSLLDEWITEEPERKE